MRRARSAPPPWQWSRSGSGRELPMTDKLDLGRRELMQRAALTCVPMAVARCARFVSPVRTIPAAATVDGNVAVPLSAAPELGHAGGAVVRSEEHTSELQ